MTYVQQYIFGIKTTLRNWHFEAIANYVQLLKQGPQNAFLGELHNFFYVTLRQ